MTEIIAPKTEAVLIEAREEIAVISPQQEAIVVEVRSVSAVITPQPEAVIIEVRRGPAGPAGAPGPAGVPGTGVPAGTNTGDIIRYNAVTGDWESCAEPFVFQGIVLVPMTLPGSPVEGFIGYNAADKGIYVNID
jgi:hypothetical protein